MMYIVIIFTVWLITLTIASYRIYKKYQLVQWKYNTLERDYSKMFKKFNSLETTLNYNIEHPYTPTTRVYSKKTKREVN
jgi:hypothetical protein